MEKRKTGSSESEPEWDRKKIVIFSIIVVVLLIFGFGLIRLISGNPNHMPVVSQKANFQTPQIDVKKSVQDQINSLKTEANNINLVDVATSSPQVQKVIHDLQALKDYPQNQLKQACVNICGKL